MLEIGIVATAPETFARRVLPVCEAAGRRGALELLSADRHDETGPERNAQDLLACPLGDQRVRSPHQQGGRRTTKHSG